MGRKAAIRVLKEGRLRISLRPPESAFRPKDDSEFDLPVLRAQQVGAVVDAPTIRDSFDFGRMPEHIAVALLTMRPAELSRPAGAARGRSAASSAFRFASATGSRGPSGEPLHEFLDESPQGENSPRGPVVALWPSICQQGFRNALTCLKILVGDVGIEPTTR